MFKYQSYLKVDLDKLKHNYKEIKNISNLVKMCAVVKANAYGQGAAFITKELEYLGIDYFAVSNINEALELRKNGIFKPIMILGYISNENIEVAIKNNIELTVYDYDTAVEINNVAKSLNKICKVHIKIDTGMTRLGFQIRLDKDKCLEEIFKIYKMDNVVLQGIYSHFSDADSEDYSYTKEQYNTYIGFMIDVENRGITVPIKHIANDAGAIIHGYYLDMLRCGIGLYGYHASDYVRENSRLNLEEISSLYTTVSMIKTVPKGTDIGYGRTFTTNSETVVATATIGYADGYPLELSNKAYVIINGKKAKILGKVCMDQIMIDVSFIRDVKVGDKVLLFGKDDMGEISLYDLAEMANTNVYELLCRVTMRIPRIYTRNGKVVEVCDYLQKIN